ncbi:MAG: hypothetical protein HPY90_13460 [Syntrophothermus sp.]|nr:hypothetical protein [Syntrophothermus sp.]
MVFRGIDDRGTFYPKYGEQCARCKHLSLHSAEDGVGSKCTAFKRIPREILEGRFDHRNPYPGDGGIRFEPRRDLSESAVEIHHMPPGQLTPAGGAVAEVYYFDEEGNPVPKAIATRVIIRELDSDGRLIRETFGTKSKG